LDRWNEEPPEMLAAWARAVHEKPVAVYVTHYSASMGPEIAVSEGNCIVVMDSDGDLHGPWVLTEAIGDHPAGFVKVPMSADVDDQLRANAAEKPNASFLTDGSLEAGAPGR
jgi:hypothetical protein